MCSDCQNEYDDIEDRRYFSQTNTCPECSIRLSVSGPPDDLNSINTVLQAWRQDQIVAIKGIGGYLLTCDATSEHAIKKLRERKHRPSKPFAVMYPDIEIMKDDVNVNEKSLKQLTNHISPIVLTRTKKILQTGLVKTLIAPGLNHIGVMLPYAPLLDLLLNHFRKPIVATSGNLSGDPIEFNNDQAMANLSGIADVFLHNNREIVVPQDDSLIAFSPTRHQKTILRRSRGMAPTFFNHFHRLTPNENVLSMGGLLKSTFGLITQGNIYISQYLGDTDSYNTQLNYQRVLKHLLKVTGTKPDKIICDAHPGFFSTQEGIALAQEWKVELIKVQHHKAHFAAVLGENDLLGKGESVLGFIWDGVGLGDDRNVWGGETFILKDKTIERTNHIPLFKYFLGDKMSKEPRLSALALLHSYNLSSEIVEDRFNKKEMRIYDTLLKNYNGVMTTSMGRVFDAVASLLLGYRTQSYEGEAAMKLEAAATKYYLEFRGDPKTRNIQYIKQFSSIISRLLSIQEEGVEKRAFQFHRDLVGYILSQVKSQGIKKVAFSGGVFQNQLLVDLIIDHLDGDYELYWHQQLSPNDENISFGQLMYDLYDLN
jgi:hydrogenase maturation protein HypF